MKEERKKILEMVRSGQITIEEAEKLLEELTAIETMKHEKEESISTELASLPEYESAQQEESFTKQNTTASEKSTKDKLLDLFDSAIKKIKDFDLDFHHSVPVSHVFQQNDKEFENVTIDIPNGSVAFTAWDHSDIRVECEGKVYRTEDHAEGKEKFLKEIECTVEKGMFFFLVKDKFMKVDVRIFVPQREYVKLYIKLFNGGITTDAVKANKLDFQTVNGQITIARSEANEVDLETGNGNIQVKESTFDNIEAETMNGKVTLDGSIKKVEVETISGTITTYLYHPQPESINLTSATGNIYVKVPHEIAISGECKSNLGNVQVDLQPLFKIEEKKEVLQKVVKFNSSADMDAKTYLFADAKTGSIFVQPM